MFFFLRRELGVLFSNDAGFIDSKKKDLIIAQSAKDDSPNTPVLNNQFELPMECGDDVEMSSLPTMSHNRDVIHKVRGVCHGTL